MHVVTGTARGTNLYTLEDDSIRPTSQRIKEAEFSTIQFHVAGARVLDLFAGTGQMGIEALSRGALSAVFVDNNDEAISVLRRNIEKTKFLDKAKIIKSDAFRYLFGLKTLFDIAFIDPPYRLNIANRIVRLIGPNISTGGFVLCETELGADMPSETDDLQLSKQYKYGKIMIWLYRKNAKDGEE